jgi:hypothetical protein
MARARQLSGEAFAAALRGDWRAAMASVSALLAETDGEGMARAMADWCDACLAAQGVTRASAVIAVPEWRSLAGQELDVSGLDRRPRWAGQLIAARGSDDMDGFNALLLAVQGDPETTVEHILALLRMTAATVSYIRRAAPGPGSVN